MIQTSTRYYTKDKLTISTVINTLAEPYVDYGFTDGTSIVTIGPTDTIPADQIEVIRNWTTVSAAENWITISKSVFESTGVTCLKLELIEK